MYKLHYATSPMSPTHLMYSQWWLLVTLDFSNFLLIKIDYLHKQKNVTQAHYILTISTGYFLRLQVIHKLYFRRLSLTYQWCLASFPIRAAFHSICTLRVLNKIPQSNPHLGLFLSSSTCSQYSKTRSWQKSLS